MYKTKTIYNLEWKIILYREKQENTSWSGAVSQLPQFQFRFSSAVSTLSPCFSPFFPFAFSTPPHLSAQHRP
jgi:hypothetical protein